MRPIHDLVRTLHLSVATAAESSDAELLARVRDRRDPEAFEAIVRRHGRTVLTAARTARPDDVDDVFQATFLVLFRNAPAIRSADSLGSWLFGVARRIATRSAAEDARRRGREAQAARPATQEVGLDASGREVTAIVHDELARLPAKYRSALWACYFDGLTRDEAAAHLGCTVDALRGNLERGRARLRMRLAKRGVSLPVGLLLGNLAADGLATVPDRLLVAAVGNAPSPRATALATGMAAARFKIAAGVVAAVVLVGLALAAIPGGTPAETPTPAVKPKAAADEQGEVYTYSGRVLDPNGKPLANAKVFVNGMNEAVNIFTAKGTTAADGTFRFSVRVADILPRKLGSIAVGAFAEGYGPMSVWAAKPNLREGITLRLPAEAIVRGRVVDTEGKPIAGVKLYASVRGVRYRFRDGTPLAFDAPEENDERQTSLLPTESSREIGTTDRDGKFEIRGLGRDWLYEVDVMGPSIVTTKAQIVTRPAKSTVARELSLSDGSDVKVLRYGTQMELVAKRCKPIQGVVRDKRTGKPVAGVTLRTPGNMLYPICWTATDRDGKYTLTGLPPGNHLLEIHPAAKSPFVRGEIRVDTSGPGLGSVAKDIDLIGLPTATGRVTNATGAAVSGWVEYRPLASNPNLRDHPGFTYPTVAIGPDGRFTLAILPGEGVILAYAEGNFLPAAIDPGDQKRTVAHADDAALLDTSPTATWPAHASAYRRIRVDGDGATQVDVSVKAGRGRRLVVQVPANAKDLSVLGTRTLARDHAQPYTAGKTDVVELAAGEVRHVYAMTVDGLLAGHAAVREGEPGPVELKLRPTVAVSGRIVDSAGKPVAGAVVQLRYAAAAGRAGVFIHKGYMAHRLSEADVRRQQLVSRFREKAPDHDDGQTNANGEFRIDGVVADLPFELHVIPPKGVAVKAGAGRAVQEHQPLGQFALETRPPEKR